MLSPMKVSKEVSMKLPKKASSEWNSSGSTRELPHLRNLLKTFKYRALLFNLQWIISQFNFKKVKYS
jgi:hypothetical protein